MEMLLDGKLQRIVQQIGMKVSSHTGTRTQTHNSIGYLCVQKSCNKIHSSTPPHPYSVHMHMHEYFHFAMATS